MFCFVLFRDTWGQFRARIVRRFFPADGNLLKASLFQNWLCFTEILCVDSSGRFSLSLSLSLSLPPSLSFSPSPSVFIPASAPLSLSPFFSNYNSPPTTGCHSTRGNLKRRRKRRRTKKKEKKEGNKEGQIREVTCLVAMLAHLPPDGRYSHYSSFLHYTSISGFYSLAYPADSQAFLAATVIGLDSGETSTCYQQLIIHGGEKYANWDGDVTTTSATSDAPLTADKLRAARSHLHVKIMKPSDRTDQKLDVK